MKGLETIPTINNPRQLPVHVEGRLDTLSAATETVKRALVVQPRPDALGTAQASLFPLLMAAGHEVFNLQTLRHEGLPSSSSVRYRLQIRSARVAIDMWAVGEDLERPAVKSILPEGGAWGVRSNGSDWQLLDFTGETPRVFEWSLFDETFGAVFKGLFAARSALSLEERLGEGKRLLQTGSLRGGLERLVVKVGADIVREHAEDPEGLKTLLQEHGLASPEVLESLQENEIREAIQTSLKATQLGFVRPAPALVDITLADVEKHSKGVRGLKGHLETLFDDKPVEIRSRSGYLLVLASLALQHGREDAVPSSLLVRPPDHPEEGARCRPLGRPGWFLTLPAGGGELEQTVSSLLDSLNLRHRFHVSQRGQPFPAQ